MNETPKYSLEDIEKFIEINKIAEKEAQTETFNKLLNVQNKISIFKNIDPFELKAIIYDLKFIRCKLGDYIVKQNDSSNEIFFIMSGKCEVLHNTTKVGTLKAGEVFGESAAIFKTKRNASVICSSEGTTLLSFCIDDNNLEFCTLALAMLYKNLALQINSKLEDINYEFIKKLQQPIL